MKHRFARLALVLALTLFFLAPLAGCTPFQKDRFEVQGLDIGGGGGLKAQAEAPNVLPTTSLGGNVAGQIKTGTGVIRVVTPEGCVRICGEFHPDKASGAVDVHGTAGAATIDKCKEFFTKSDDICNKVKELTQ